MVRIYLKIGLFNDHTTRSNYIINQVIRHRQFMNFINYTHILCFRQLQDSLLHKDYPYFSRVLDSLPKSRSLAFAYGSGVFKQAGKSWTNSSMSDFIIATDNPRGMCFYQLDQKIDKHSVFGSFIKQIILYLSLTLNEFQLKQSYQI